MMEECFKLFKVTSQMFDWPVTVIQCVGLSYDIQPQTHTHTLCAII